MAAERLIHASFAIMDRGRCRKRRAALDADAVVPLFPPPWQATIHLIPRAAGNLLFAAARLISLPFVAFGVVFLVFFLMFSNTTPRSRLSAKSHGRAACAYRHDGFDRSWGEQFAS